MRTATWANIGTTMTANTEMKNGLPAAFDFDIEMKPLGFTRDDEFVPTNSSTVINIATGRAYGPVSKRYSAISNRDALGVISYMEDMTVEKFGELTDGTQYLIGSLPSVNILGDETQPYLIFRNSFNGRYPIQVAISPLRIVCQNQLTVAFRDAINTVTIKHNAKAEQKVKEAQQIMLSTADYMRELNNMANKYSQVNISEAQKTLIINELFPIKADMKDATKEHIVQKRDEFITALKADDLNNFRGTSWQMIQAYADYLTHKQPLKETKTFEENRFVSVTFDPASMMYLIGMLDRV